MVCDNAKISFKIRAHKSINTDCIGNFVFALQLLRDKFLMQMQFLYGTLSTKLKAKHNVCNPQSRNFNGDVGIGNWPNYLLTLI